jgi:hypothetical protein
LSIENSERFILYCLCGCFVGITIILLAVIIVIYIEKRKKKKDGCKKPMKSNYQIPRTDVDVLSGTRSHLPVYRYDGRNPNGIYHV